MVTLPPPLQGAGPETQTALPRSGTWSLALPVLDLLGARKPVKKTKNPILEEDSPSSGSCKPSHPNLPASNVCNCEPCQVREVIDRNHRPQKAVSKSTSRQTRCWGVQDPSRPFEDMSTDKESQQKAVFSQHALVSCPRSFSML